MVAVRHTARCEIEKYISPSCSSIIFCIIFKISFLSLNTFFFLMLTTPSDFSGK